MTGPDLLQAAGALVAIAGALAGGLIWLHGRHRSYIDSQYLHLGDKWTNEGAIGDSQEQFLHLTLSLSHGDLVGTLTHSDSTVTWDANVTPGWPRATLRLRAGAGRVPLGSAKVKLRLAGNMNRIRWRLSAIDGELTLPKRAELWPVPQTARGPKHQMFFVG